ncbi:MAG: site-specific integrase [Bacteroidales bacterium]|nr:site-specific integrase [Bacteroidales bacterium]MBP5316922.1 site-specific integrase [Bacteroidales bacterium]
MGKSALRLDTRRALKDGTYPVQIKVGYGTNLYLSTGIYLAPSDWNAKLQVCIGPGSRKINNILGMLLLSINNRIAELMERGVFTSLTKEQLRQMLTNLQLNAPTVDVPTLGQYFTKVIELKTGSTRTSYDQTRKRLTEYCGDLDKVKFSDLNYSFLEGWQKQLSKYKRNTISRRMKDLKAVIRYAYESGVEVNPAYLKIDSSAEDDTPLRSLPVAAMRKLIAMQLSGKKAMYRDAFVLSFLLIGINPTDLKKLTKDSVVNGRLHYKRSKTGKNYSIRIEPEAQAIIDRYAGDKHLLYYAEKYKCFEQNCNNFLSSVTDGLTLYWARYSWANYAVDLDIPKDTISESLGHRHGAHITGIYIRYSLDKIDAANRAVIDYVMSK